MRTLVPLFFLVACGGESNFNTNTDQGSDEQGVAQMVYSDDYIVFTDVLWDPDAPISSGKTFTISNVGTSNLVISTLDISDSGSGVFFTEEQDDLILAPEVSKDITVVATLREFAPGYGELRVKSNYGEERDLRIPLCAFPQGYTDDMSCGVPEASDTGE